MKYTVNEFIFYLFEGNSKYLEWRSHNTSLIFFQGASERLDYGVARFLGRHFCRFRLSLREIPRGGRVEQERAVRVELEDRGGDLLRHGSLQHAADHFGLVLALRDEDDAPGVHNRADAEGQPAERIVLPDARLPPHALLEHGIHRGDPGLAAEGRPGLIDADMPVVPEAEHLQVRSAARLEAFLEFAAFLPEIVGDRLRHEEANPCAWASRIPKRGRTSPRHCREGMGERRDDLLSAGGVEASWCGAGFRVEREESACDVDTSLRQRNGLVFRFAQQCG